MFLLVWLATVLVFAVAGWIANRWWVVVAAAVLPVVAFATAGGLDPVDENGNENWGIVILPFYCLAAAALAAAGVRARRWRQRQRGPV